MFVFTAVTSDVKLLRDSIDTVSQLIDEANFVFKSDRIELTAADRATVAVLDLKIFSKAFEEYKCDKESVAGLNLLNLLTVLKRAGPGDKIMLRLDEEKNKLEITLYGQSIRNFSIPVLQLSCEEIPSISQFEFPVAVDVAAGIIQQGIEDADVISDSIVIEVGDTGLRMFAEGDASRAELKLEKGSPGLTNLNAPQVVKSRYPIDYLKKMMKAVKLGNTAKIQMGNDYPMKIEFASDQVQLAMVLAPRVNEE